MWILYIIALIVGILLPIQGGVNSQLSRSLGHPLVASFFSFVGGVLTVVIANIILKVPLPSLIQIKSAHWTYWMGGVLGASFVTSVIYIAPRIGFASFLMLVVCGQLFMSMMIDHFGLFGVNPQPATLSKIIGILIAAVGVYIFKFTKF